MRRLRIYLARQTQTLSCLSISKSCENCAHHQVYYTTFSLSPTVSSPRLKSASVFGLIEKCIFVVEETTRQVFRTHFSHSPLSSSSLINLTYLIFARSEVGKRKPCMQLLLLLLNLNTADKDFSRNRDFLLGRNKTVSSPS